jgi:excisionase family DNA binding protein
VPTRRQSPVDPNRAVSRQRGRYLTLEQASQVYPVFTFRLLRRLVEERRIPFSRAGRRIVLSERDIEQYLEANRVEPPGSLERPEVFEW